MPFYVLFMKIDQPKNAPILFSGPFLAGSDESKKEASERAGRLIEQSVHSTIITKIYDLPSNHIETAMELAEQYFERMKREITETAVARKRRKRSD